MPTETLNQFIDAVARDIRGSVDIEAAARTAVTATGLRRVVWATLTSQQRAAVIQAAVRRARNMRDDWEERYDIREVRQSSFVGGMKPDGWRIYYSVRFVEFDFGDARLPADIEENWQSYEFVKIWRDNKYASCEFRKKAPGGRKE